MIGASQAIMTGVSRAPEKTLWLTKFVNSTSIVNKAAMAPYSFTERGTNMTVTTPATRFAGADGEGTMAQAAINTFDYHYLNAAPESAAWGATHPYTIEFFFSPHTFNSNTYCVIYCPAFDFVFRGSSGTTMNLWTKVGGSNVQSNITNFVLNANNFMSFSFDDSNLYSHSDGIKVLTLAYSTSHLGFINSYYALLWSAGSGAMNCTLADIRVSKVARYGTNDYTPPSPGLLVD